jgi:hypothetical protein
MTGIGNAHTIETRSTLAIAVADTRLPRNEQTCARTITHEIRSARRSERCIHMHGNIVDAEVIRAEVSVVNRGARHSRPFRPFRP